MVGRNILEHAAANDWDVLAPSSSDLDLTNAGATESYLAEHKPDFVVHAAGQVGGIQANMADPVAFLERNTSMGRNIVMASYNAGVRQFLNLASTCMYPRDAENPLREDMILTGELEPTNEGYALAKIMTTRLCQYISRKDDKAHFKTLIPCNLFGRFDTFSPHHSHLLPAVIRKVHFAKINNKATVEIWGDGNARREFMYAADLADAIMKSGTNFDTVPDLMNCGIGHDHTINEYYQTVADVVGWSGEFVHDLSKPVGMKRKLCSVDRQTDWGWSASTSLHDGIKATYHFFLKEVTS